MTKKNNSKREYETNPVPYEYSYNWYTGTLTVYNKWGIIAEISGCENMSPGRIDRFVDEIIEDFEDYHGELNSIKF